MAYVQVLQVRDTPMEEFRRVHDLIGPGPQDGLVAGAAAEVGAGFCVVTIWESKADLDRFTAEKLGPALVATAAAGTPEFPVSAEAILLTAAEHAGAR
jgi:hypothetical protein